jgi:transposase-like protein
LSALGGELTHHLGYPSGGSKPDETTNHRNGSGAKTVLTDDGPWRSTCPAIATAPLNRV